jgi:hypothetical protein
VATVAPAKQAAMPVTTPKSSTDAANYKTQEFGARLNQLLVGSKFLYRDTSLSPEVLALYRVGLFFRDPTPFDTSHRFSGLTANTRFLVISSSPINLSAMSENPEWGLCVFKPNELFKVVDVQRHGGFSQVTVLHIPDGFEHYFRSTDASYFEARLTPKTRSEFQEAMQTAVLPDLASAAWRERTALPPGINASGKLVSV